MDVELLERSEENVGFCCFITVDHDGNIADFVELNGIDMEI